jgi:inosose dehydratase
VEVRFAYQANCWGPLGGNAVGVTSVGQLTYLTFGDMRRAIAEIGAAGYQGVELFDGNVLDYPGDAAALKPALARVGAQLVAAYSGANFIFPDVLDQELGRIARAADAAAALSAEHLIVGGGAKRLEGVAPRDYERLAAGLEKVVAIAKARGLRAHYHPHLSTIVEGPAEVDRIFSLTSIQPRHRPSRCGRRGRASDDPQAPGPHRLRSSEGPAKGAFRLHAAR